MSCEDTSTINHFNDSIASNKEGIQMGCQEIVDVEDDGDITLLHEDETPHILSFIQGATQVNPIIVEDLDDGDDGVRVTKTILKGECSNSKFNGDADDDDPFEIDDEPADYPPKFTCDICTDSKPVHYIFRVKGCDHFYCSDCMAQFVTTKIQDNVTRVTCPVEGCHGIIESQDCRDILPRQVYDRWGDALCEEVILASQKFYCPFKDCSALLIDDGASGSGGDLIRESECPNCWRLFCAQCKVPWHADIACADFQKLNSSEREREDILLMNLAKTKNWTRCPRCRFYVERIDGCLFMKCRCGYTFCYNCGAPLVDHYCRTCKR